jgi:DNA-binding LytR/AlgR family response regulator
VLNRRIVDSKLPLNDLKQPIFHTFKLRYPTLARCLLFRISHSGVHLITLRMKGIYRRPIPSSMSKASRHCLVAAQSPTPALGEKGAPATFNRGDCILLTDDIELCIVRIEDISLLEACENFTLVHLPKRKLLIKRALKECERRLDSSIFFRASRFSIVNLRHVKQPRLDKDGSLIFVMRDGKEVVFSRRQTVLFRRRRGL